MVLKLIVIFTPINICNFIAIQKSRRNPKKPVKNAFIFKPMFWGGIFFQYLLKKSHFFDSEKFEKMTISPLNDFEI
jgi:hypothetical protein